MRLFTCVVVLTVSAVTCDAFSPEALQLDRFVLKLQRDHPVFFPTTETAETAIKEYRRFLRLHQIVGEGKEHMVAASKLVDLVWHEHILDTKVYMADSNRLFGRYLHHYPCFVHEERPFHHVEDMRHMYQEAFGSPPPGDMWETLKLPQDSSSPPPVPPPPPPCPPPAPCSYWKTRKTCIGASCDWVDAPTGGHCEDPPPPPAPCPPPPPPPPPCPPPLPCKAYSTKETCAAANCMWSGGSCHDSPPPAPCPPPPPPRCSYENTKSWCVRDGCIWRNGGCHTSLQDDAAAAVSAQALGLLPDVVLGWNTSVGSAQEREQAAAVFHKNVTEQTTPFWTNNVMQPFIAKTLRMTAIDIEKRNAFNTLIELAVKTGTVLWTISPGPMANVTGDWVEHINGKYTGTAKTAGFVSGTSWIENDHKSLFGHELADDWGFVDVASATDTKVVMKYRSYKKGVFTMTWELTN